MARLATFAARAVRLRAVENHVGFPAMNVSAMRTVALIWLFGCGGSSSKTAEQQLVGDWFVPSSATECGLGIRLREDGTYRSVYLCELTSGAYGAIVEDGAYTADASSVAFHIEKTSCPSTDEISYSYSFSDGRLVMMSGSLSLVLDRENFEDATSQSGAVTYGCFDSDGNFTPMPETAL